MFEAALEGFSRALSGDGLLFILLGTWYGMLVGVLPGISGGVGLILLIPITFGWPLDDALVLFAGAWGGTSYGGAVTAILIGVPGETTNAVTMLDGYPLAKKGRAAYALGASAMATAAGATIGLAILVMLLPVLRSIVLFFGPAEFFAMALLGIAVIAVVSADSLIKGLVSGSFGLLLGAHGLNPVTGVSRFDLGTVYLTDGIPLIPAFIGVFALAQGVDLLIHHQTVADPHEVTSVGTFREIFRGMRAVFRHFGVFLRSSILGTVIGAIPGPGGTVATYLAYGQAVASTKDSTEFGAGDIRGVIAPEAANDAKDGGALIPTITFGVPGTFAAALIMLALQFHGLRMGPRMLDENLPTTFVLLTALFLSNWVTSATGIGLAKWLVRVTTVSTRLLAPGIIVLSVLGAFAARRLFSDVIIMFVFGLIGYVFIRRAISPIPMVIALLLAPLLETTFHQTYQLGDSSLTYFLQRPIAIVILVLVTVTVILPPIMRRRRPPDQYSNQGDT